MAGVNGIYGLITAIVLMGAIATPDGGVNRYSLYTGFAHLSAGLCCGLCGLASGMAIGLTGGASVLANGHYDVESKKAKTTAFGGFQAGPGGMQLPKKAKKKSGGGDTLFVVMVLIQVFAGNLALYGLITSIILSQSVYYCDE